MTLGREATGRLYDVPKLTLAVAEANGNRTGWLCLPGRDLVALRKDQCTCMSAFESLCVLLQLFLAEQG